MCVKYLISCTYVEKVELPPIEIFRLKMALKCLFVPAYLTVDVSDSLIGNERSN